MKRYFSYKDEKSDKFWSIEIIGNDLLIIYGKTGTAGQTNSKSFGSPESAEKEAEKLIRSKLKKGYQEVKETSQMELGEGEFWSLIKRSKQQAEDVYEQAALLTEMLSERSEADILSWGKIFDRLYKESYQSRLWAAAYIINGGCSDDGFDYFRAWLIAQGENTYVKSLENPEYLARVLDPEEMDEVECEDMMSVACDAYCEKTGKDYDSYYELLPSTSLPEIDLDWEEDEAQLKAMFPKLYAKF